MANQDAEQPMGWEGSAELQALIAKAVATVPAQQAITILDGMRMGHKREMIRKLRDNPEYVFCALLERCKFADDTLGLNDREHGRIR